jgi:uncharacterized membrane protein YdjX (TVP38/TMEM64 family)
MTNKKILVLLAFTVIIALIIYASASLQNTVINSVNSLGDYFRENRILGGLIFFGISVIAVLISPFSSLPLIPSAVLAWGSFLTFFLLFIGWIIGGIATYLAGSYSRDKIIKHFFSLEKIEYYKKRISARSQFWLVFLFRLAIPSEIAGYTLGIIRYQFGKYLLATFLAELPFALFVVYSSSILLSGRLMFFAGIVLVGLIIFYYIYREFNKRIKSNK